MQRQSLIDRLLESGTGQKDLIHGNRDIVDLEFARRLKDTYYRSWTSAPDKTRNAAQALEIIARILKKTEADALALWVRGIANLSEGRIERALRSLDGSSARFLEIGREHDAAQPLVGKLVALAMLGRYDESIAVGRSALTIFEKYGDELAAGKIEKNLGNVVARRGQESLAEKYYLSARRRFTAAGSQSELAMCDNSLANTYAELNDFINAEKYYASALAAARRAGMCVTEAEIEASLGNLALFRGRLDESLRYLELSRQKYAELEMPHQKAVAELEIAEIYLELNLSAEAFAILKSAAESLRKMKLRGDEARARSVLARAAILQNDSVAAKNALRRSARLYMLENNPTGAAAVRLSQATFELREARYRSALKTLAVADDLLLRSENPRQKIFAEWLKGEILCGLGDYEAANSRLTSALKKARGSEQTNLMRLCLNSLGEVALKTSNRRRAKRCFAEAADVIETLREPLPAEEFRMSFMADKFAPLDRLAEIYLDEEDFAAAFQTFERAKARTLTETLHGAFIAEPDERSAKFDKKMTSLREELNWFYSRSSRAEAGDRSALQAEAERIEREIDALNRQITSMRTAGASPFRAIDIGLLQERLGGENALVEYVVAGGRISAFTITSSGVEFAGDLASEADIFSLLEGLRFQFGSMRFGKPKLAAFEDQLKKRADAYLQKLFDRLLAPIYDRIAEKNLIVVPAGLLHYVPFNALRSADGYLIENCEVTHSPSAAVWLYLQGRKNALSRNAMFVAFADEKIPFVETEVGLLREIMPDSAVFAGERATFENYVANAPDFSILHLACHGQFRSDNPMFSSLHLANGFVTVRDICSQRLTAELVTLSACETGLSKIYAGDEILGLTRGFLSAGAASLLLSLWTVNDEATTRLMASFYENLQLGHPPAASLREAQSAFIKRGEHPYLWSPFVLIGK